MIWALFMAPLMWALYIVPAVVLYAVGPIVVPMILTLDRMPTGQWIGPSKYFTGKYIRRLQDSSLNLLLTPWMNEEDGLYPDNYAKDNPSWSPLKLAFMWLCIRNPVSGLRWLYPFSLLINSSKVEFTGSLGLGGVLYPKDYELKIPTWVFIWHGPFYSCLWWQFKLPFNGALYRFWIGNAKLYASDRDSMDFGYRAYGTSGVLQLKAVQPGNNKN